MKKFLHLFLLVIFLAVPHFVLAEPFLDGVPCISNNVDCGFADVEQGFILLTKWLIGGVGALALLYFIWGGIQWLTSYGSQEKIRHGREIMFQTVIALVIAFLSFLLVEFFVNDLLQSQQQITSDGCAGQQEGKSCGTEANYVCSGSSFTGNKSLNNELCITKCQLKNLKDDTAAWACLVKTTPNISSFNTEPGLCPGDYICANVSTIPIDTTNTQNCCISSDASQSCRAVAQGERCASNENLFRQSCEEINICQSGYHQTSGCCISQDIDGGGQANYSCQQQSAGEVCDAQFLEGTSCDSQTVCN